MGIDAVVRFLLPKEDHFFTYLERQAILAHEGALALANFKTDGATPESVREKVQEIEHKGDKVFHELGEALAKTFVTPIDREDIQKLSSELDDILDLTNGAARACVLFGIKRPTPPMVEMMEKLVECTKLLKDTIPLLRKADYAGLTPATNTLRKLEKDGDAIFRAAIAALFQDETIDAKKLIREREVLDDLETAIDHCDHVASTLRNLAAKHA